MKKCWPLAWALCVACSPHRAVECASDVAVRHQWRESFRYRQAVEQAVNLANQVLEPSGATHFAVSWKMRAAATIPVTIVDGDRLPPQHIVFVPDGEEAVVINSDQLPTLLKYFESGSELASKVRTEDVLAFCLLHEAGHIRFGDHGSFVDGGELSKADIVSIALSKDSVRSREIVSKNHELRADLFAVDAIEGAQASAIDDVHDAGVKLYLLMSNLEWNMGLVRDPVSAGFGGDRTAFLDTSYTHPNLEFRLRVVETVAESKNGVMPVDYILDLFLRERTHDVQ